MPHHSALAYGRATLRMLAHNAGNPADRFAACYLLSQLWLTICFARNLAQWGEQGPIEQQHVWRLIYDLL